MSTYQSPSHFILFKKLLLSTAVALLCSGTICAQSLNWAFLKGYGNLPWYATYGTQGVAAPSNTPGARQGSVSWQIGGKLYLFGGNGYNTAGGGLSTGNKNDLWEYDTATGSWRWLKGSGIINQTGTYGTQGTATAGNTPGARQYAASWTSGGKLYLFGGSGYSAFSSGRLNDLWEYDTVTEQWRWLKGSNLVNQTGTYGTQNIAAIANTPGGRQTPVGWQNESKLYLFGGSGIAAVSGQGNLNDLWEYDTATGNWRWLKGSNAINQTGTYGTQGTAAAANVPGARQVSFSWESAGKLYLFGGNGFAASGQGQLNDLWEFDSITGNWRWIKGSNSTNQTGTYGTPGTADAANTPGARQFSVSWESSGKLYLFGGTGYAASGSGFLNDLWEYDTTIGNWRWLKGSNAVNQTGTYGTQGTASAANAPGARNSAVSWMSGGKLYLFGGNGFAASGQGQLNDLWEFDPTAGNWQWLKGGNLVSQIGVYGTQGIADSANLPGPRWVSATWESGGKLYMFGGTPQSGELNDLWEYDTSSGNWRWLKGSNVTQQMGVYGTQGIADAANAPGARHGSIGWKSGGKLYLFGGYGVGTFSTGYFNDLWEYDIATGNWRWLKGSNDVDQRGTYGTQGVAAASNKPGARTSSSGGWESGGKLYLFGGYGYTASALDNLNDLWEYDISTGNWKWLKGSSSGHQPGTYGTQGTASVANTPGARTSAVSWMSGGKFFLFGGSGYDAASNNGSLNDLWEFNTLTSNWRWLKGSSSINQNGIYGTLGNAATANTPGARYSAVGWENNGNIYLFGGFDATQNGSMNDFWEYNTITGNWKWMKGSNTRSEIGTYSIQGVAQAGNIPGARQNSNSWGTADKLYLFGGYGVGVNGEYDSRGDLWSATFVSTNANLSALALSSGTLSPTFATATTSYTASVSNGTTSITVTPAVADATATVTVNGTAVTSGSASGSIALNVGSNTLTTVVTAQDGSTTKTYTVTATRAAAPPVIVSFSPLSAKPGDAVTLTGTGFNTTTTNNVVFFGATKATVTAATSTSLTVTLPTGATYAPISVLNVAAALIGYSTTPFTPTFTPTKGSITTADIAAKVDFAAGTNPTSIAIGDLDGDGMPDLAVANQQSGTISLFRNTASNGSITTASFAAKVDFATGSQPLSLAIGDLDGDGKPDLAVANYNSNTISVFRNTASSGSLASASFAANVDFSTGTSPREVAIGDLDGDGKPDMAVANQNSNTVSIFRNTSTSGSITSSSFDAKVDFTSGVGPGSVAVGDLDGDGKPDLAITNSSSSTVSIIRNTSTSGSITSASFAAKIDFTAGNSPNNIVIGDLDGDAKPDLAVANVFNNTLSVFRNTSTSGTITSASFTPKVDFTTGSYPPNVAIGDVDGDGKSDLAVTNQSNNTLSVFRNTASSGSIASTSFAAKVDFPTGDQAWGIAIGDLDGDGKPDFAVSNRTGGTVSVLRNTSNNSDLASLTVSSGTLSPVFAAGTTSYTASVTNATTSITVTPTRAEANATITVNGTAVTSGSASGAIALNVGSNTITTVVTAQNATTKTYTVTVTRAASTNANLSALALISGTLSPTFATATISYTASVSNATTSITVTPTVADATATVTVNGTAVTSGSASGSIALSVGSNTLTTAVTAQDGSTTKTYTVTVTRAASTNANLSSLALSSGSLSPTFASATTSYTASVSNATTSITLTPTVSDATATVTVNGTAVTSGSASGSTTLNVGSNTITTIVTAQDGSTTKTYTVTVTRASSTNANLSALALSTGTLSPTFASATTSYTASVSNATTSITVTPTVSDATATVTLNGTAVTSGSASQSVSLNEGPNTVTTIVTAQDGSTTKTYTVTVNREYTVLPVDFLSVHAVQKGSQVEVTWKIANQQNVKSYVLEKYNGSVFVPTATIAAVVPAPKEYVGFDPQPTKGINYYQVRSVDFDGKIKTSEIAKTTILNGVASGIAIGPNPVVAGYLQLSFSGMIAGTYNVSLADLSGRVVFEQSIRHKGTPQDITLNVNKVNSGLYLLRIRSQNYSTSTKIVIQ